jgi:hypothetical protein
MGGGNVRKREFQMEITGEKRAKWESPRENFSHASVREHGRNSFCRLVSFQRRVICLGESTVRFVLCSLARYGSIG